MADFAPRPRGSFWHPGGVTKRDPHRYVFRSEWRFDAPADAVYSALDDVEHYPVWWPQIRAARWIDDKSGELVCRSLLPYDLTFVIERELEDPVNRILRGKLVGDLTGESQWTITPSGERRCVAVFDEDVTVSKGMIRAAGRIARPALKFNHGLMMRSGEAGLRKSLDAVPR